MKKKKYWYYRSVGTQNERRYACKHSDHHPYIRAKRKASMIADSYWDQPHGYQKSWKMKRKTQYRPGGRGAERKVVVGPEIREWDLKEYFDYHDIPYKIEAITKSEPKQHEIKKRVSIETDIPKYHYTYDYTGGKVTKVKRQQIGWETTYKWVNTGKYRTSYWVQTLGYEITWWSDKDIGIDDILENAQYKSYWW